MALAHGKLAHLLNPGYKTDIAHWLAEDCPTFDYGGFVVGEAPAEARLLGKSARQCFGKQPNELFGVTARFESEKSFSSRPKSCLTSLRLKGILAGVPFFDEVFRQLDCTVEWHVEEGTSFEPVKHCATVRGPVRKILLGERVALNTLARCSGIATKSARLLALVRAAGYHNTLAGTRKTTPGFRLVEKYGMLVGGCDAHRHDLSSMTMLKDNHVWATGGSITAAVHAAKAVGGFAIKVEVECQTVDEAAEAVRAGADIVMLDNFTGDGVRVAAQQLRDMFAASSKEPTDFLIEVSGGLTEQNVRDFVCPSVDILSTSSIHQGVQHIDFSLKIVH